MIGKLIEFLLDKLYPVRCAFCGNEEVLGQDLLICSHCRKHLPYTAKGGSFDGGRYVEYVVSPFFYKDRVREAIIRYKFCGKQVYHKTFSAFLAAVIEDAEEIQNADLILPVPLSKRRLAQRGYNQSALIARDLSEAFGIECDEDILIRIRNTRRQSKVSLHEKHDNVRDAFACTQSLEGKRVLLIDDIYTTGATMNECARTMKAVGCEKVYGASVAVYPRRYKMR